MFNKKGRPLVVIILFSLIIVSMIALPLAAYTFDFLPSSRDDDDDTKDNNTNSSLVLGPAPDITLYDRVPNGSIRLSEYKGRMIILHFMKIVHLGGDEVSFNEDNKAQIDILIKLRDTYPEENISLVTVLVPNCCMPSKDLWLNNIYDQSEISWHFENDLYYKTSMAYFDYIGDESGLLIEDPTIVLIDRDFKIISVSGFVSFDKFDRIISNYTRNDGYISEEDLLPQVQRTKDFSLIKAYGTVFVSGFLSSIDPCCIAMLVVTIIVLEGLLKNWGDRSSNKKEIIKRKGGKNDDRMERIIVVLGFCIGMGIIFFIIGLAAASLISLLPYFQNTAKFLIGALIILLGLKLLRVWSLVLRYTPFLNRYAHDHNHHSCASHAHTHTHSHSSSHHENFDKKSKTQHDPDGSRLHTAGRTPDGISDKCDCHEGDIQGRMQRFFVHLRKYPLWTASIIGAVFFGILEIPGDTFLISPSVLFLVSLKTPVIMIGIFMFIFGLSKGAIIIPFIVSIGFIRRVIDSNLWQRTVRKITTLLGFLLIIWGVYLIWLYSL